MELKSVSAYDMTLKVKFATTLSLVLFITLAALTMSQFTANPYFQFEYFQLVKALKGVACLALLTFWRFITTSELSSLSNVKYGGWEVAVFLLLHTIDGLIYFTSYDPVLWHKMSFLTLSFSAILCIRLMWPQLPKAMIESISVCFVVSAILGFVIYSFNWNKNTYSLDELPSYELVISILSAAVLIVLAMQTMIMKKQNEYELSLILLLVALVGIFEIYGREGFVVWWSAAILQIIFISGLFGAAHSLNRQAAGNLRIYKQGLNQATSVHFCGNEKGKLVFINEAFRDLFGIDADAQPYEIQHPFLHHPIWHTIMNTLQEKGHWSGETMVRVDEEQVISVYGEFSLLNVSGTVLHQASLTNLQEQVELRRKGNVAEEKLERLSFDLMDKQEEERRFFAKELHDEIGQGLTLLKIQQQLPEPDNELIKSVLSELIDKVRNMSLNLRPAILDDMGLSAALVWLADRQAKFSKLKISTEIEEQLPRFDDKLEISVFRIAQEAFTNIHKYSHADHVIFTCRLDGSYLTLVIQDNGVGFDVDSKFNSAVKSQSLGLISIKERAFLINGRVTLESSPEFGTNIGLRVPINYQETDSEK